MNDIDLSDEALLARRAIAEKADIPGPWFENGEVTIRPPHGCEQEFFEVADEGDGIYEYNIAYCHSKDDAAHIAANSPNVVIAHIDEIIRLRDEVKRLREDNEAYRVVMSNFQRITTNLAKEIDDNDQEVEEHTASLEAQIDWLAARCSEFCNAHNWCNECCMLGAPYVRKTCDCGAEIRNRFHKNVIFNMRELARKAVEKQCQK